MITIMFSCNECEIKRHKLQIPARESAEADVVQWMRQVAQWVKDEHKRISPKCNAKEIKDLMIPMKGPDGQECEFIGQQLE
jgi:hypothetical protein